MPTCPYHGNQQPCRDCVLNRMGQFAHHPRGGVCPYHGKAHPCIDCFDMGMGQFAHASGSPNPAPKAPAYIPPGRRADNQRPVQRAVGHNHGGQRPCKIRCGVNEGLSILNNQVNVSYLYTDSLANCTQVIFRNAVATFTTHVLGVAREPRRWINRVHEDFVGQYGRVTLCRVVTSDNPTAGFNIGSYLELLNVQFEHWPNCGGCAIGISDGNVIPTPTGWNPTQADVAGWQTAADLIHRRWTGEEFLGEVLCGDYSEMCRACN